MLSHTLNSFITHLNQKDNLEGIINKSIMLANPIPAEKVSYTDFLFRYKKVSLLAIKYLI
jgi:hypothetical protein